MDEKYGKVFKKIRTGRGLSLQNATGGNFSQSMLSRFENGQSEMSAEKLFDCLDNIYLSISEYDYLMKDYKISDFYQLFGEINKKSFPFQRELLEQLILSELEKSKRDGRFQYHKLNIIMIKAAIKNQDPMYDISADEIEYLSNYLFTMDIWIEYELILFISTYSLFPYDVLVRYCEEMIQRVDIFQHSLTHSNLVQTILINVAFRLIDHKHFDSAHNILNMFDENFSETRDAYMKIIYKLAVGYYQVKRNSNEGKELILKTLDVMEFLDYQKQSNYYREQFKDIL